MKKLLFLMAVLMVITLQSQTIHVVDNNEGSEAEFDNLQEAIDDANAGDIIYVQPSPNTYGSIEMKKRLSIYGIAPNPELNAGVHATINTINFNFSASDSKLSGLNITNIYLSSQSFNNHNVVITNNRLSRVDGNSSTSRANNAIISGNYIKGGGSITIRNNNSQNWIISNNIIEQSSSSSNAASFNNFNATTIFNNNIFLSRQNADIDGSIQVFQTFEGTQITNNIFLFTNSEVVNMNIGDNIDLNFQNNLTYKDDGTFDDLPGANNLNNTDPQFVAFDFDLDLNSLSNDFHFQTGSSAIDAGTDGNDLGVFNGGFPFNMRGYPTELPYVTDFVIFNNIISAGTLLDINIKANANINN